MGLMIEMENLETTKGVKSILIHHVKGFASLLASH